MELLYSLMNSSVYCTFHMAIPRHNADLRKTESQHGICTIENMWRKHCLHAGANAAGSFKCTCDRQWVYLSPLTIQCLDFFQRVHSIYFLHLAVKNRTLHPSCARPISDVVDARDRPKKGLGPWCRLTQRGTHPPSQATLCWQGQKRTSRASSEQMRHSLGPGAVGSTRLVMVLGVVCTRRRQALLRP